MEGREHHVGRVQRVDEVGGEAVLLLQCVRLPGEGKGLRQTPWPGPHGPHPAQHPRRHSLAGVPALAEREALHATGNLQGLGGEGQASHPEAAWGPGGGGDARTNTLASWW